MPRSSSLASALCVSLALAGWITVGCSPAEKTVERKAAPAADQAAKEHDHEGHEAHDHDAHADHAHPETLAEGIAELESLTKEVAEKLAGDAHEAADHAVHAAGHLIDDVRALVEKETLTADAKAAATKALDEIYECFDKLDVAIHAEAKEGAETVAEIHASIADRVAQAVQALKDGFSKEEK